MKIKETEFKNLISEINTGVTKHAIKLSQTEEKETKRIQKSLNSECKKEKNYLLSNEKNRNFLQTILDRRTNHVRESKKTGNQPDTDTKQSSNQNESTYPCGFTYVDFNQPGCLRKIANPISKEQQYLYFNESFIKGFKKLEKDNSIVTNKFRQIAKEENLTFAKNKRSAGIKVLGSENENPPKCELEFNGQTAILPFKFELKINESDQRIGIISFGGGKGCPNILMATHCLKNGLHDARHNGKILSSNRYSLFNQRASNTDSLETVNTENGDNEHVNRVAL